MNKKIIAALAGAVLLSLGAASAIITNASFVSAQAQNQSNAGTQGNATTGSQGNATQGGNNNETVTAGNATLQLHAQLDAAIVAAQNNDTLGVLTSLSQIIQGLAEINRPAGNATEIAATSNPETTASNQTGGNAGSNQSATANASNAGSNATSTGSDNPSSESDNPFSSFT